MRRGESQHNMIRHLTIDIEEEYTSAGGHSVCDGSELRCRVALSSHQSQQLVRAMHHLTIHTEKEGKKVWPREGEEHMNLMCGQGRQQ